MGALSIWHILILGIIVLLLFGGGGKISDLMADVGKGVKSFREGLNEPKKLASNPGQPAETAPSATQKPTVQEVAPTPNNPAQHEQ